VSRSDHAVGSSERQLTDCDIAALVEALTEPLAAALAAHLSRNLFGGSDRLPLGDEIARCLSDGVPRTAPEIGKLVKRRREVVEKELSADLRFVVVSPPFGRSPKAQTWGLAFESPEPLVPTRPGGAQRIASGDLGSGSRVADECASEIGRSRRRDGGDVLKPGEDRAEP
jgi:hypothetical protein